MPFFVITNGIPENYGSLVITSEFSFSSIAERDQYFLDHPEQLKDQLICSIVDIINDTVALYKYDLVSEIWLLFTNTIKGDKGDSVNIQYSPDTLNWFDVDNNYKYIRFTSLSGVSDIKKLLPDNVIYNYGQTANGTFSSVFNPNLTYWAKVSLDGGNTFGQSFRMIGEDGLSFVAQYAPSTVGPWSNTFVDGVHEYLRFSNDGLVTWTPAQRFKILEPLQVEVNSVHLGGHDVISTNENFTIKNNVTGINYFPVWQGISDDGNTVYGATEMVFDDRVNDYPLNGNIRLDTILDYDFTRTYTDRILIINTTFRPAENYTGDIKFQLWSKNGTLLIYTTTIKAANLSLGQNFTIPFYGCLFVRQGNVLNTRIVKANGTPIKAYAGSNPNQPWRTVDMMPYRFVDVINSEDTTTVVDMLSGLVGDQRLSIDALKGTENLKIGTFKGSIDFNGDLTQFQNALTNDYWKSESNITFGGLDFNIGDKLFVTSPTGTNTITTLDDPNFFYLDENINGVATSTNNGIVKPVNNLVVELDGSLYVRQADYDVDGVVKLGVPNQAAKLDDDGKLPIEYFPHLDTIRRITVNDELERYNIPVSNRFTIVIQIDTNSQWYLSEFKIPSTPSNWVYGGSIVNNDNIMTDTVTGLRYTWVVTNGVANLVQV